MLFAAQKLRKQQELNNPTVIIVADRVDLDTQIIATFNTAEVGNMNLIKQLWLTNAGGFQNASQNYSQVALASLFELENYLSRMPQNQVAEK